MAGFRAGRYRHSLGIIILLLVSASQMAAAQDRSSSGSSGLENKSGTSLRSGEEIPRPRPEEGVALLARGPYSERGMVFLSTNVIDYRAGEYRFHQGDVTVLFPSRRVFLSESWQASNCGTVDGLFRDINESFLKSSVAERVYMVEQGDEQIFFHFRGSVNREECPFIERFLLRYDWFSRISKDPGRLSLPAVVEYGG